MTILKLLVLLIFITPICMSIQLQCYPNGGFKISPIANYSNMSCSSCQCLAYKQNYSPFQCDEITNNCFIYRNNLSSSDLRIQFNLTTCLFDQTSIITPINNNSILPLYSASTENSYSPYYVLEKLLFITNISLSYFILKLTAYRNNNMTNVGCFYSLSPFISTFTLNKTDTSYACIFTLHTGFTIDPETYYFYIQFNMPGETRNITGDIYEIWTQPTSSPTLIGHF